MKQKKWKKVMLITLLSIVVLIVAVVGGAALMFKSELRAMNSIEKIDDNVLYSMEYKGDYGLDEFLKTGASTDDELINFITKRLLKGLPVEFSAPDFGCSTFNAQTEDGDKIFGRNFDLSFSPALFVLTEPENGYKSLSTVNLGFLGYGKDYLPDSFVKQIMALAAPYVPLDGMNEKGLSVGVLLLLDAPTNQNTPKVDITTTTAIRMLLDKAATVDEAISMLEQYDMHSSAGSNYHFQIADAFGSSIVVEYIDNKLVVVKDNKDYQMATNFYLSDLKNKEGLGQDRYEIMKAELDKREGIVKDEKDAMGILEEAAMQISPTDPDKMETQWSVIYNNTDITAKIITSKQFDKPAHEFNLKNKK